MATYHVSNKLWADTDSEGTSTGGGADYILLKAATSQSDDAFNNWGIYIVSGTGAGQSRRIIDYDQTGHGSGERYAQVDAAWGTNPDATSVYEICEGTDQNNGLSDGVYGGTNGAWRLPSYAADNYAAADIVYFKGGRDYVIEDGSTNCIFYVDTPGTAATPFTIEGFTTTPGDDGVATFNAGTNSLVSAIITAIGGAVYGVFKNLRLTGGSGDGFDANGVTDDFCIFRRCRSDNNTGYGVQGDNYFNFYRCEHDNNTAGGVDVDISTNYVLCSCHTNSGNGFYLDAGTTISDCLFYENGGNWHIRHNTSLFQQSAVICNNSFDGGNQASSIGIKSDHATAWGSMYYNNIFFDLDEAIHCDGDIGEAEWSSNNLYYSNNTDRTNCSTDGGDVTGSEDPYTNSGGGDYSLKTNSEAIAAGLDAGSIDGGTSYNDIGAVQKQSTGGGGGLLQGNVRGNMQ